jgi:hypothetical protein
MIEFEVCPGDAIPLSFANKKRDPQHHIEYHNANHIIDPDYNRRFRGIPTLSTISLDDEASDSIVALSLCWDCFSIYI